MAAHPVLTVRAELDNAVVVRPGDKLVLGYAKPLTVQEAHVIKERLTEKLPGVEVILADQLVAMTVYRDDDSSVKRGLQAIWNRIEESDEAISPAWLRRVIVESGAWAGEEA